MSSKTKILHLQGLNGIRAIAAIAVIISHTTGALTHFGLDDSIFGVDEFGNRVAIVMASNGVTMFFALSGFLITYLLLLEKNKTGTISVRKFYVRRILRIWPLYYFYIIIVLGTYSLYNISFNSEWLPFYIFLTANIPLILQNSLPYMGHLWSIGVEEQFYLFWPYFVKRSTSNLLRNSIIFFLVFYMIKLIAWWYSFNILLVSLSVTRFHIMMIGSIAAILYYKKSPIINIINTKIVQAISWFIIALAVINKFHISSALVDSEVFGFITIFIIIAQIQRKNYIVDLDIKVLNFIGKISFGAYVYHPLIIYFLIKYIGKFKDSNTFNYLLIYGLIILLTIIVSYLSYEYLEKPFIKLKGKYQIAKSRA